MIKNYFKIAWRNVIRHKTHSAVNVTGLALGITCCMFIFLWVHDEKGIDNFHENGQNLFVAYQTIHASGQTDGSYNTPIDNTGHHFLLEDIKQAVPEVKNISFYATGYDLPWGHPETIQVGDKIVKFNGARTGSNFFEMFSYPVIVGNSKTALKDISSIAISRRMADVFFGGPANAIGKTVRYENKYNFIVTGVFENVTPLSSLKFDFLLNWEMQKGKLEWSSNDFQTFVQLADHADVERVEVKINQFLQTRLTNVKGVQVHIGLQKFGDQYLHNHLENGKPAGGRIEYVKIFSEAAIFIMIIACINFMNLATARSVKRAKEVGMRKVVGSTRGALIGQFFAESIVFSFLSMLLSIILLLVLLPAFNQFVGKQFGFPLKQTSFWVALTSLTLVTGIIAGSYPALYLSSLKPVRVLKGALQFSREAIWFRKGLTVFQFVLSTILLIATIVITRQTSYVQTAHLGYDRENMVYMRIEGELSGKNNYLLFKQEALKMPGIAMVDRTTEVPQAMNFVVNDDEIMWQGKVKNSPVGVKPASVGFDFIKLMKLKIAEGRGFSAANATDSTTAFMVNEEAVKEMGMKNPIGKWVSAWKKRGYIIGVLKDYHTQSLHEPIKPILLDVKEGEYFGVIVVRMQPGQTKQALASLATIYKNINPKYPFTYQFVDEEYGKLYSSELIISKLSIVFGALAIVISCLGLLGLVMFSAEQRVKEFGVRKVLGASFGRLFSLFAQEFLKLVFLAFLIGIPLGWYVMNLWLQAFAYRITLSWWIFVSAGFIAIAIAFVTISFQSAKSALMNPVKSLRSE